jgi:hypothetical protein
MLQSKYGKLAIMSHVHYIYKWIMSEMFWNVSHESIWQTKIIMFRKGGFLAEREKWKYVNDFIEVVNSYKYLGFILP